MRRGRPEVKGRGWEGEREGGGRAQLGERGREGRGRGLEKQKGMGMGRGRRREWGGG